MDEAKKKRVSARGWLTRAAKRLDESLAHTDCRQLEIVGLIEEFENRLRILDEIQQDVEAAFDNEEDLEADIESSADFRDEKVNILLKAKETLSSIVRHTSTNDNTATSGRTNNTNTARDTKLPRLELPAFSGNYTEWQPFWDKFSAVIDISSIPTINKFTYLQTLVKGEAASAITGLSLTESNYENAKDILQKRFGRPERIIFGHIQDLLKGSSISKENSVSSKNLWHLYDTIQNHVRSLESLNINGKQYGVFLTPLVLHQLPSAIRLEWARNGEGHEGDLDYLLTFLYDEIRRRERSQTFQPDKSSGPYIRDRERKHTPTASTLVIHETKRLCVFCKKNHYSDKCEDIRAMDFEERKEKIKRLGLCFLCLGRHRAKDCNRTCYFCKGAHHSVLCKQRLKKPNPINQTTVRPDADDPSVHVGLSYVHSKKLTTLMQVVHAEVHGSRVCIMFDSGSDRSFITKDCAKKLRLKKVDQMNLTYCCFGEDGGKEEQKEVFQLNFGGNKINLICMKTICAPMFRSAVPKEALSEFTDISFVEDYQKGEAVKVDILIGLDWYWSLIKAQRGSPSQGLVAQKTVFGWMVSGVYLRDQSGSIASYDKSQIMFCQTAVLDGTVRKMWELESIGIEHEVSDEKVENDFLTSYSDQIDYKEGRYIVTLPWKNENIKDRLLNNREIAEKRLTGLNRKFHRDPRLQEKYDSVLSEYEKEGIISEVPQGELEIEGRPIYYLPHRPVMREDSMSTKVRPVFDASCKGANNVSLNDCMEVGPKLIPDLVQILLRFRRWKFGLTADIKKAFLQILLHSPDQDVHRFLWNVDGQIRTMKFERVCFGNACSPFLLNATIRKHLLKFEVSPTIEELRSNLYVDDWLTGADREDDILKMRTEAHRVMEQGGFDLTKWTSNCKERRSDILKSFDGFVENHTTKVLGLSWNTEEDSFVFETLPIKDTCVFTKRLLLSTTARLFDPLGFLAPFTISLRIAFQETWRQGFDWDEVLPEEIQKKLNRWMEDLKNIKKWRIPRCISLGLWTDNAPRELLIFADASEKAYGCCIYMKTTNGEQIHVSLVMSRVKVAPLKKVTLPRLELLAALLAARLLKFVVSALDLNNDQRYTCWTDSKIVLNWIKGDPARWKQFIRNRVTEIQHLTDPSHWRHCSGETNPADFLTRGVSASTLLTSRRWLCGPDWLNDPHTEGDEETIAENDFDSLQEEQETTETPNVCSVETQFMPLIDFERFSCLGKLLRVIGLVLKFVKKTRKVEDNQELNEAKLVLFRSLQNQYFREEVSELRKGRAIRKGSPLGQLSPFIGGDRLLRVEGRLEESHEFSFDEKHPIILPKCHVTLLLVRSQHVLLKHAGVNLLMTSLRNKYWIVSLRQIAKRVIRFCVDCQRQDSRLMEERTGLLPKNRITKATPFSIIGVDYAGPLFCSDLEGKKLYILLFTCAVTRAVHLELVDSLTAADFCLALKKFASRRAMPAVIYSDNAKTFKGVQALCNKELGHETIRWKKQPALAPWWGGFYERMVRCVKSGLRKSIGRRSIPRKELETALTEVEACINSRPLTGSSDNDSYLTPSHFLIGRGCPLTPPEVTELNKVLDLSALENDHKKLLDQFWAIWRLEYIRSLPPLRTSKRGNRGLCEGTLVLIHDANRKRMMWDIGRVVKLFSGTDGCVRMAQIRTKNQVVDRPIQRLIPLELDQTGEQLGEDWCNESANDTERSERLDECEGVGSLRDSHTTRSGRPINPRKVLDL